MHAVFNIDLKTARSLGAVIVATLTLLRPTAMNSAAERDAIDSRNVEDLRLSSGLNDSASLSPYRGRHAVEC